jgi:hypothetical protein
VLLALVSAGSLVSVLGFLLVNSDRGFDLTDEGFYLLSAAHPADVTLWPNAAHWFTSLLFRAANQNVVVLRTLGVAICVLASLFLATAIRVLGRRLGLLPSGRNVVTACLDGCLVILGGALGYTWFLLTPAYNGVNAWALVAASGGLFCGFGRYDRGGEGVRVQALCMAAAGVCVGVSLFAKFPTGLSLLGLFLLVIVAWPLGASQRRLVSLGAFGGGVVVVVAGFFLLRQSAFEWWASFRGGLWMLSVLGGGQNLGAFHRYWNEWRTDVIAAAPTETWGWLGVIVVCALTLRLAGAHRTTVRRVAAAGAMIGVGAQAYISATRWWALGGAQYFGSITGFCFTWVLVAAGLAISRAPGAGDGPGDGKVTRARAIFVLLLLVLPLAGAVGTGHRIYVNMVYVLAPWFAFLALALGVASRSVILNFSGDVLKAALAVYCAVQIIGGSLTAPYRLDGGLASQVVPTDVGAPATALRLNPAAALFVRDLRAMAGSCGFRPGDNVLMFFDAPGIVFALGGRSPGIPWYSAAYPGSRSVAERSLRGVGVEQVERSLLIVVPNETLGRIGPPSGRIATEEWLRGLGPLGIHYPENYTSCGTLAIPYAWSQQALKMWYPAGTAK